MHKPSSQILNLFYKINWKFDCLDFYAMNIKNPRYVINKADNQKLQNIGRDYFYIIRGGRIKSRPLHVKIELN